MENKNKFTTRKFKYGAVAVALTVVFCTLIILLNALFSLVADKNGGFYIDLTKDHIYDLSDNSLEIINALDKKVEIVFCMTEDKLLDNDELAYIKRLAEKYASVNENITIVYKDLVKEPSYFVEIRDKIKPDTISQSDIIINCPDTKRFVKYSWQRFFKLSQIENSSSYRLFAYDGENKFTSAIKQTALNKPQTAGFISGHGEEKFYGLTELLINQGYEINDVDLKAMSQEQLNEYDLLIISNPKYDYTGYLAAQEGRTDEIGLLNNYLTNNTGNLLVFLGNETPNLPELSSFLADDWGVLYSSGNIVIEGASMAYDNQGLFFNGTPSPSTEMGSMVHSGVTKLGVDATIFGYTTPLYVTFTQKQNKIVSPVYTTSKEAYIITDITEDGFVKGPDVPVMTLSKFSKMQNNTENNSYVLVCGSLEYMNALSDKSYANSDVLNSVFSIMGNENVVTGIDYKVLEDTSLSDITNDTFKNNAVMLTLLVPVIIAIIGVIVYIRRKAK